MEKTPRCFCESQVASNLNLRRADQNQDRARFKIYMAPSLPPSPTKSTTSSASRDSKASLQRYGTAGSAPQSPQSPRHDRKGQNGTASQTEGSPLLSPESPSFDPTRSASLESLDSLDWEESKQEPEPSKSIFYLFILTLSIGGLQVCWATELSKGSPYLQSLGMSKSLLAFVWIAGPLGGVLVQPYVGIRSDNCRSRIGKRLPFMIGGALTTAISFLCLAWTREMVQAFLGIFGANPDSNGVQVTSIVFAIIWVYILDFSINTVQAAIRAFIVDNAPLHQQEDANAWAGRMTGIGNILGYISGYEKLPKLLPWLGHTQMQVLCAIAAIAICSTVAISALSIRERDPRLGAAPSENPGLLSFFVRSFQSAKRMPLQIRRVCIAQFFAWLGWFGFLFYMTTYVGQIKLNPYFASHPDLTPDEVDDAWEDATRYATFALLIFAIVSFLANVILPFFVHPTYAAPSTSATFSASNDRSSTKSTSTIRHQLSQMIARLEIKWLTLRRAWLLSHLMFALCMFSTFFVFTSTAATILTAIIGIPWAFSHWAPFALISAEIAKRDLETRRSANRPEEADAAGNKQDDQAGVILGLHNVAISAPQILATLISSIIFKVAQRPRGEPYDTSVGWVLRLGGLAALLAAYFTYRIGEEGNLNRDDGSNSMRYERVEEGVVRGREEV